MYEEHGKLVQIISCQNEGPRASSCIELSEIRKLDSLLNQCESISCDNLLLYDDIYNYDLCKNHKRKSLSTTAIDKVPPKNSIKRRTHKKLLGIREHDKKIINYINDKKQNLQYDDEKSSSENHVHNDVTQSCSNLVCEENERCDKIIQTSSLDFAVDEVKVSPPKVFKSNLKKVQHPKASSIKKKRCTCRDYMCETSLTIPQKPIQNASPSSLSSVATYSNSTKLNNRHSTNAKKSSLIKRINSSENNKSFNKFGRLSKQKNTVVDDNDDTYDHHNVERVEHSHNRIININEATIEIIPISTDVGSPSTSPRCVNGADVKSETKSETQSQKSKRSKFSPLFISRKLTSRFNSEEDNYGGAKESLLGRNKSVEKKLPEPVETVCKFLMNIFFSIRFQYYFASSSSASSVFLCCIFLLLLINYKGLERFWKIFLKNFLKITVDYQYPR